MSDRPHVYIATKPAGTWHIVPPDANGHNSFSMVLNGKPSWRNRMVMRILCGWVWVDWKE